MLDSKLFDFETLSSQNNADIQGDIAFDQADMNSVEQENARDINTAPDVTYIKLE
jgi:hypothetical protein